MVEMPNGAMTSFKNGKPSDEPHSESLETKNHSTHTALTTMSPVHTMRNHTMISYFSNLILVSLARCRINSPMSKLPDLVNTPLLSQTPFLKNRLVPKLVMLPLVALSTHLSHHPPLLPARQLLNYRLRSPEARPLVNKSSRLATNRNHLKVTTAWRSEHQDKIPSRDFGGRM